MDAQAQEYDRFGPWAIEISDEDPPPPLFEPYLTRAEPALLSVKIPRHIERRAARPGTDLYDYLISLYEDDVMILQRVDQEVRSQTCRYQDVQHLCVKRCLLRGVIHLGLPGRSIDLPYNTVSDKLMQHLAVLVRERYCRESSSNPSPGTEPTVAEGELSFYFERLLAAERNQPDMHLLAAQGTVPLEPRSVSAARRLVFGITRKRLLESLHLTDGRELKIVDRGKSYAYRWETCYSADTSFIPIANVRAVTWREDDTNGTTDLILRTGGGEIFHAFAQGNPSIDPYAAFLAALPRIAAVAST